MSLPRPEPFSDLMASALSASYQRVRTASTELCRTLEPEDYVVQSMPDVSPTKWHLAHTTWFFERFVLSPELPGYREFHPQFGYLFNSYYYTVGQMHLRPRRGLLTRPTVREVLDYRCYVDEHLLELLGERGDDERIAQLVELGLNHEQQHQELMLTDIKHVFAQNPLQPAFRDLPHFPATQTAPIEYLSRNEGVYEIGATGDSGFCFDNETPRHRTFLRAYSIASRPVTNGEYREFVRDGGYEQCELWLSDAWATVREQDWQHPLYWSEDCEQEFTLGGLRALDESAPVCHVSLYEADAFARWAGQRLPTEAEWEVAAQDLELRGNFVEEGWLHPIPANSMPGPQQMFGDVWEWTASSYSPYPGFRPLAGSLGEYNGKFMCNQMVLRGGSCATANGHVRATYRNFFYPGNRWQFSGIRLAKD